MEIERICSTNVVTADQSATVFECAQLMREHHVGDVIITKETGSGESPIGILTDRDIVVSLVAEGATDVRETPVEQAMSKAVVIAKEGDDLHEVLQNMEVNGIRRVPVVDDSNTVTGIVSFDDLIKFQADQFSRLSDIVSQGIQRETERDRG